MPRLQGTRQIQSYSHGAHRLEEKTNAKQFFTFHYRCEYVRFHCINRGEWRCWGASKRNANGTSPCVPCTLLNVWDKSIYCLSDRSWDKSKLCQIHHKRARILATPVTTVKKTMTSAPFLGPHTSHTLSHLMLKLMRKVCLLSLLVDEINQKRVTCPGSQLKSRNGFSRDHVSVCDTATTTRPSLLCQYHLSV